MRNIVTAQKLSRLMSANGDQFRIKKHHNGDFTASFFNRGMEVPVQDAVTCAASIRSLLPPATIVSLHNIRADWREGNPVIESAVTFRLPTDCMEILQGRLQQTPLLPAPAIAGYLPAPRPEHNPAIPLPAPQETADNVIYLPAPGKKAPLDYLKSQPAPLPFKNLYNLIWHRLFNRPIVIDEYRDLNLPDQNLLVVRRTERSYLIIHQGHAFYANDKFSARLAKKNCMIKIGDILQEDRPSPLKQAGIMSEMINFMAWHKIFSKLQPNTGISLSSGWCIRLQGNEFVLLLNKPGWDDPAVIDLTGTNRYQIAKKAAEILRQHEQKLRRKNLQVQSNALLTVEKMEKPRAIAVSSSSCRAHC